MFILITITTHYDTGNMLTLTKSYIHIYKFPEANEKTNISFEIIQYLSICI